MMRKRTAIGQQGESIVAEYLCKQGFTILERNYRQQFGEIDIIAHNRALLIFVEVKTRQSCPFDFSCVITPTKQKKIAAVARHYLTRHTYDDRAFRFDVALVENMHTIPYITYIPQAFVVDTW